MRRRDELAAALLDNGNGLAARFLDNGALFGLHAGDIMVNLVLGSPMGGALGNLFLRSFDGGAIASTALIGPRAPGRFVVGPDSARWLGRWHDIEYDCAFELDPQDTAWAWRCRLTNRSGRPLSLDLLRHAFATKAFTKVLRPIVKLETFGAGPRDRAQTVDRP